MTGRTKRSTQNSKDRNAALGTLSPEGSRLLRELAPAGRYLVADPLEEGALILRCARAGMSLGGGRFPIALAEELERRDLLEEVAGRGRRTFRISDAGLAHAMRATAHPDHAFAAQHRDLVPQRVDVDGRRAAVTINAAESPLDWLRRRKGPDGEPLIDEACFQAGERLRRDLTSAAMLPRVTANWSAAVAPRVRGAIGDPAAMSDVAVAARQRVTLALEAVGPDFADLLIDLCGFLKGLEEIERDRAWPIRSGKVVAKLALARLANHYGLERSARGPERSRGVRAWREAALGAVQ